MLQRCSGHGGDSELRGSELKVVIRPRCAYAQNTPFSATGQKLGWYVTIHSCYSQYQSVVTYFYNLERSVFLPRSKVHKRR